MYANISYMIPGDPQTGSRFHRHDCMNYRLHSSDRVLVGIAEHATHDPDVAQR